ncbi:unnamed protein product [Arctia plantaginis]|uniref:Uncharacterized protein n=1 Tax=Arctia plantaginis TaxID=874455 RepID=A0A8S1BUV3_ARCPL|nr:unnamed protein product [Arctia plantaginis]
MNRSDTKSKAKKQKNKTGEDVDTIIPKILARRTSISEAPEHSTSNKKPAKTKNVDNNQSHNQRGVFTKEQEVALRNHIIKCCQTQYGVNNTTIRKIIYEYAKKIPNCVYPKGWDNMEMACMHWFLKFRGRHPGLKKSLTKKLQHTCICIMGCHMGRREGKQALKKLEAGVLIARVYHYLYREYEYMKMCNDLSLLVNILRRTAEATGVCEQTITKILEEEKRNTMELNNIIPGSAKRKRKATVADEHSYSCNKEGSNVEAVDEDSSSSNNVLFSDFERLQQGATSIKSVMVEILDEDFEETEDHEMQTDTTKNKPKTKDKPLAKQSKMRIIFDDDEPNKPDTRATQDQAVKPNSNNPVSKDPVSNDPVSDDPVSNDPATLEDEGDLVIDESETQDIPQDAEDTGMRIDSPDFKYIKTDTCATEDQVVKTNSNDPVSTDPPYNDLVSGDPASLEYEGDLVIDESQMNLDYSPDDRSEDTKPTEDTRNGIDEVIPIRMQHGNPGENHTIPSRKRRHPMDIYHGHMKIAIKNATSLSVDDRMTS